MLVKKKIMTTPRSRQPSLFQNAPEIMNQTQAQHSLSSTNSCCDEGYSIYLDDESEVSTITCSIMEEEHFSLKRTRKSLDLAMIDEHQETRSKKRRRRGTSYTIVEIHSLLHLMKRVLPKCADEWELIRMVHCRIFPNNDRTVISLKKKFRDLCRNTSGLDMLDERFRAQPVHGEFEVKKAREVQQLISLKPPGYQLILPKTSDNQIDSTKKHIESLPSFQVKVPNPLCPIDTQQVVRAEVPKFIQIQESPLLTAESSSNEDDMSDIELDEFGKENEDESVIVCPMVPKKTESPSALLTPSPFYVTNDKKLPVVITDQK